MRLLEVQTRRLDGTAAVPEAVPPPGGSISVAASAPAGLEARLGSRTEEFSAVLVRAEESPGPRLAERVERGRERGALDAESRPDTTAERRHAGGPVRREDATRGDRRTKPSSRQEVERRPGHRGESPRLSRDTSRRDRAEAARDGDRSGRLPEQDASLEESPRTTRPATSEASETSRTPVATASGADSPAGEPGAPEAGEVDALVDLEPTETSAAQAAVTPGAPANEPAVLPSLPLTPRSPETDTANEPAGDVVVSEVALTENGRTAVASEDAGAERAAPAVSAVGAEHGSTVDTAASTAPQAVVERDHIAAQRATPRMSLKAADTGGQAAPEPVNPAQPAAGDALRGELLRGATVSGPAVETTGAGGLADVVSSESGQRGSAVVTAPTATTAPTAPVEMTARAEVAAPDAASSGRDAQAGGHSSGGEKGGIEAGSAKETLPVRAGGQELVDRLGRIVLSKLRGGEQRFRLQLQPQRLGHLQVDLNLTGKSLQLSIHVESEGVRHMLVSRSGELQHALQNAGIDLDQLRVDVNSQHGDGRESLSGQAARGRFGEGRRGGESEQSAGSEQAPEEEIVEERVLGLIDTRA